MLTDLKNTENLLLTSQRMHQNKKILCVIAFQLKLLPKHRVFNTRTMSVSNFTILFMKHLFLNICLNTQQNQ